MRKFYCLFQIRSTVLNELSWSHYLELIKIEEEAKRNFYIKETINSKWSVRELQRQIGSLLLVFYNRLLKCFVIIDLKIGKVTHQDIGQMQMYVNYYDREIKSDDENPTVGILLSTLKNKTVVKYTLPEDNKNIFSSSYKLHLPTEQELIDAVEEEKKNLELN